MKRRNLPKLLSVYWVIEEYIAAHYESPTMKKLIELGVCKSTNTVKYYYKGLIELHMAVRLDSGRVRLLPLNGADPAIQKLLKEN